MGVKSLVTAGTNIQADVEGSRRIGFTKTAEKWRSGHLRNIKYKQNFVKVYGKWLKKIFEFVMMILTVMVMANQANFYYK